MGVLVLGAALPVFSYGALTVTGASTDEQAVVPPRLAPSEFSANFAKVAVADIASPDGRAIAVLDSPPAGLSDSVSADFPYRSGEDVVPDGAIAFAMLSAVRYSGEAGSVLLTASQPSAAAQQLTLNLGETTLLPDGTPAWTQADMAAFPDMPNQLVFERDGLLITLASSLPTEELAHLALDVELI